MSKRKRPGDYLKVESRGSSDPGEIRMLPLDAMNPAPYNPRKDLQPGDPDYEALKRSVEEFGHVQVLVWNEVTGNLVGGHQTYKVLKDLGYEQAAARVVSLGEAQEKALNVALNRVAGDWDYQALEQVLADIVAADGDPTITGFTQEELDELMARTDARSFLDDMVGEGQGGGWDHEKGETPKAMYADEYRVLNLPLTDEQRQVVLEAVEHAKAEHGCETTPEALMLICQHYLAVTLE